MPDKPVSLIEDTYDIAGLYPQAIKILIIHISLYPPPADGLSDHAKVLSLGFNKRNHHLPPTDWIRATALV